MCGYSSTDSGMELPQNKFHAYKWQLTEFTFQNWMQSTKYQNGILIHCRTTPNLHSLKVKNPVNNITGSLQPFSMHLIAIFHMVSHLPK